MDKYRNITPVCNMEWFRTSETGYMQHMLAHTHTCTHLDPVELWVTLERLVKDIEKDC